MTSDLNKTAPAVVNNDHGDSDLFSAHDFDVQIDVAIPGKYMK